MMTMVITVSMVSFEADRVSWTVEDSVQQTVRARTASV